MRVSRQWRVLGLHQMFGFAHNDIVPGVGDLAEFCPACPQPGINLPVGWENNPQQ